MSDGTPSLKRCPKVILEGTRLTFKTEIAFELNDHPRVVGPRKYRYHSPLVSAEWCAFTNVPWGRGMINFAPEEEALAMETYETWVRLFELQRYYSWIVDRFHISTRAYQLQTRGKDYDFRWVEDRIAPLGFRLVFCTRTPESFAEARRERLKVSGNPGQYDDLAAFVEQQELMERLVAESRLPTFRVDMTDNDVPAAVERIEKVEPARAGCLLDVLHQVSAESSAATQHYTPEQCRRQLVIHETKGSPAIAISAEADFLEVIIDYAAFSDIYGVLLESGYLPRQIVVHSNYDSGVQPRWSVELASGFAGRLSTWDASIRCCRDALTGRSRPLCR